MVQNHLKNKEFEKTLNTLEAIPSNGAYENKRLREAYFSGGNLAYAGKEFLLAVKFYEGAKRCSDSLLELKEAEQRIYFTFFIHFYSLGQKLLKEERIEDAEKPFAKALMSYKKYPLENQGEDKARAYMTALVPAIKHQLARYEPERISEEIVETLTEYEIVEEKSSDIKAPKAQETKKEGVDPAEIRMEYKLAVSTGIELFHERRFGEAMNEFEKALKIRHTDKLVSIMAKCKLGESLSRELLELQDKSFA